MLEISVVEPFHISPAPAPASQDGGSGSSSSSSSSPVVHNLLLEKKFLKISLLNLPGLVFSKKGTMGALCFALPVLYIKRQINFSVSVRIMNV